MRARRHDVVVTRLWGGLGNQLFQLAAGLLVGSLQDAPVVVDRTALDGDDHRDFGFGAWTLPVSYELPEWMAPVAAVPGAPGLGPFSGRPTQAEILGTVGRLRRRDVTHLMEGPMRLSGELFTVGAPCVLSGYWQAWQHVAPVRDVIRAALLGVGVRESVREKAARLADTGAVAVHVRRTDFLGPTFGGVTPEYVKEALTLVGDRPVRLFSDDLAWCAENLDVPVPAAMGTPDEDLLLMASCRAHVVANSTFSWWGATLADSEVVVAPRPWFRDPALRNDDLVPPTWLQLDGELTES